MIRPFFLSISTLLLALTSVFSQPNYTVYLIGDTGDPVVDGTDVVFDHLKRRLDGEGKNSTIVFLGDNIYHNGMPPESKGKAEREEAEKKILVQLDALRDYKGEIYFIPGNHDWNDASIDGIDYIRAQEDFIEFYLDRGDVLIPDHGCPGPEVKKLGKNTILVAMDSQWWLHPHPDDDIHHTDCGNKNKFEIIQELKEILDKNDDKFVVLVFHHPIYSDGSHNGYFTLGDHLFPLANLSKTLYIPLPVIGSLYPFYRSAFGVPQDMPHPLYADFKKEILNALYGYDNIMIASGHEHNLQYFKEQNHHFIKSGSGSKRSPLPGINQAVFNSTEKGYAKLDFFENGEVMLTYYTVSEEGEDQAFQKTIITSPVEIPKDVAPYVLDETEKVTSASSEYKTGGFHQLLFGKLYRKDWATESTFRTINLSKELGGLTPVKAGGGMTSNSLRLEDTNERQFVLRSVQKNVTKVVPEGFRNTFVEGIFQDQVAASQPYAALAVPPLASAIGVYHTTPEIVFLPKQPALGDFNQNFGDELYLFEARPAGDREDDESFGQSRKIISYSKMIDKILKTPKHHIHQEQVLRSRLFDMYLGDWDRHDDQWRWASFKEFHEHDGEKEEVTFYEPIPRDRDQVFFKYQGFIPWISKLLSPQVRKFITFGPNIKNIKYLGFNARHFDRSFLNEMNRADWKEMAEKMTSQLTDEVIDEAVSRLPPEIQAFRGDFYKQSFLSRRNDLVQYADSYYGFLSKYVDVVGTDKRELFEVERREDNTTKVDVYYVKKDGDIVEELYERTFLAGETKEVRLYGLDGDDTFRVRGTQDKGPLLRLIGGEGKDIVDDQSNLKGPGKGMWYYDSLTDNDVRLGKDAKDKRSADYTENLYDRKEFYYNAPVGLVFLGFNPDDGLTFSYKQSIKTYGFRKMPYKAEHSIGARVALGSEEFGLSYSLSLLDVVKKTDFGLDVSLAVPNEVNNFFGLTSDITYRIDDFPDFDFFQYRQTEFYVRPSLQWLSTNQIHKLQVGPFYHYTDLLDNSDRLVSDPELSGLGSDSFDPQHYTGVDVRFSIDKVDHPIFPTSGMHFTLNPTVNIGLHEMADNFSSLAGSLTLYNFIWVPKPFVLVNKIEGGVNLGDYPFFRAQYAGRSRGLRAFRDRRLGGDGTVIFSNDLRVKVLSSENRTLPFSMGLIGSLDYGKVWLDGSSGDWFNSYGGGFWLNLFELAPISFYYMTSGSGDSNFIFKMGFTI